MKSEGGPLTLKTTTSRFPSLLMSPNAVPLRDFKRRSFSPALSEISSNVRFPRLRKICSGSAYRASPGSASIEDEKLQLAMRMSGHPSLSKSPNPVPHLIDAKVGQEILALSAISTKCSPRFQNKLAG